MAEQWLPVVGYEDTYAVSNLGRIMRTASADNSKAGRILHLYNKRGYLQVVLTQNNYQRWYGVHKLVAEAFICPRPPGKQVNHKDGDKLNNTPDNLEWVTCAENHAHRRQVLGMSNKGEHNGRALLTAEHVVEIRQLYDAGNHSWDNIAKLYGVNPATIGAIAKRRNWKHIA